MFGVVSELGLGKAKKGLLDFLIPVQPQKAPQRLSPCAGG